MKKCSQCGIDKELDQYAIRDKAKGTYRTECRQCIRDRSKKWRDANPGINRKYYDVQYDKNRIRLCQECGQRYRTVGSHMNFCSPECYIKGKKTIGENGCWEWVGSLTREGYGKAKFDKTNYSAHRMSYMLFKGEIAEGLIVLHSCDNRRCTNPEHLYLGTPKENSLDMVNKGRSVKGKSIKKYGLEEEKICYDLFILGKTQEEIAKERNLPHSRVVYRMISRYKKAIEKYSELLTSEAKTE